MPRNNERGAVAIFVAVIVAALLAFLGLTVDVGHFMKARGELQNGADSAALAAARELTGTAGCAGRARLLAQDYSVRHASDIAAIAVDGGDVTFGTMVSNGAGGWTFQQIADETQCGSIAAVRVTTRRAAAGPNAPVPVYFAKILGSASNTQDVTATAVAAVGGPDGECAFPFAIPDCAMKTGEVLDCTKPLILSTDQVDTWAITSLDQTTNPIQATPPAAANIINSAQQCKDVVAGQPIPIQNGNVLQGQLEAAVRAFCHIPAGKVTWPQPCLDASGAPPQIVMPIVTPDPAAPNCKLNQDPVVSGFGTFTVNTVNFASGEPPMVQMMPDCKIVSAVTPTWNPFFGASASAKLIE